MASRTDIDSLVHNIDIAQRESKVVLNFVVNAMTAQLNALETDQNRRFATLREQANRLQVNQVVESMEDSATNGVQAEASQHRNARRENDQTEALAVSKVGVSKGNIFHDNNF